MVFVHKNVFSRQNLSVFHIIIYGQPPPNPPPWGGDCWVMVDGKPPPRGRKQDTKELINLPTNKLKNYQILSK